VTQKEMKLKIKNELKAQVKKIRELKNERKGAMYGYVSDLMCTQEDYRRKHVAYCMCFNKTQYSLIESNPRKPLTSLDWIGYIGTWEAKIAHAKTIYTGS